MTGTELEIDPTICPWCKTAQNISKEEGVCNECFYQMEYHVIPDLLRDDEEVDYGSDSIVVYKTRQIPHSTERRRVLPGRKYVLTKATTGREFMESHRDCDGIEIEGKLYLRCNEEESLL